MGRWKLSEKIRTSLERLLRGREVMELQSCNFISARTLSAMIPIALGTLIKWDYRGLCANSNRIKITEISAVHQNPSWCKLHHPLVNN